MATLYRYAVQGGREVTFLDADDAYQPEDIRQHWAGTFPELGQAQTEIDAKAQTVEVEGQPVTVGKVVSFVKKVGTKGATYRRFFEDDVLGRVWLGADGQTMFADRRQAGLFNNEDWHDWGFELGLEVEWCPDDEQNRLNGAPPLPEFA